MFLFYLFDGWMQKVISVEPTESDILSGGKPGKNSHTIQSVMWFSWFTIFRYLSLLEIWVYDLTRFKGLEHDLYMAGSTFIWTPRLIMDEVIAVWSVLLDAA